MEPKELTTTAGEGEKTRAFKAVLLGAIMAPQYIDGVGSGDKAERPAWMTLATSEGSTIPFLANARMGRDLAIGSGSFKGDHFELMRSLDYEFVNQPADDGHTITTVYLPELFRQDPGMVDPAGIKFIIVCPKWWSEAAHNDDDYAVRFEAAHTAVKRRTQSKSQKLIPPEHLPEMAHRVARISGLAMMFLDRRTRCPLPPDPRFQATLTADLMGEELAGFARGEAGYSSFGERPWGHTSDVKAMIAGDAVADVFAMKSTHARLEQVLAVAVANYFKH